MAIPLLRCREKFKFIILAKDKQNPTFKHIGFTIKRGENF